MDEMKSFGGVLHNEEVKVENYFKAHVAVTAIGSAIAAAVLVLLVVVFFHI